MEAGYTNATSRKESLKGWVEDYTSDLYKWALQKTSSEEDAHDLVQDTFLAAVENVGSFRNQSSPKTWLFSILNNKISDFYRKKLGKGKSDGEGFSKFFNEVEHWRKESAPLVWNEEEVNLLDDLEFHKVLMHCFSLLPEKWDACIKFKYLFGKKGAEICEELGITDANFWQIVHRAKLELRSCIEKKWYSF